MVKIRLELRTLTDIELVENAKIIGTKLGLNINFPTPPISGSLLTTDANAIEALLQQRAGLESQVQQLTLQIRTARDKCESDLNLNAAYVELNINTLVPPATAIDPVVAAAKAQSAGMDIVGPASPVGPMPKVEGLKATQGDANGEIDLQWGPIKRGCKNYIVETTNDPAGLSGWQIIATPTKSSITIPGLPSATRHWFRVSANGSAGPGPASEPTTKVAP